MLGPSTASGGISAVSILLTLPSPLKSKREKNASLDGQAGPSSQLTHPSRFKSFRYGFVRATSSAAGQESSSNASVSRLHETSHASRNALKSLMSMWWSG